MRVDQLRAELRARGLDVAGTKQVLLARLQTAIASGIDAGAAHSASKSPTSASAASTLVPPASTPAKKPAPRPVAQTPAAAAPTPTANPQAPLARTSHASARPLAAPTQQGTASSHRATSPAIANGSPSASTGADLPHRLVNDDRSLPSSEHEKKPDQDGAPAVLFAPEKMSMEDRLAARARRFGLKPENNALLKSASLSTPTSTSKNSTDEASGSKGKLAVKTASSPGKGMNGEVDAAKRATRRDRNKTRAEKRERSPEPVVAEVLTPEEEAMRAKRAKRFGIAAGSVA
jgi:SAP domain